LWLKATLRLIELLPTHPALASVFQPKDGLPSGTKTEANTAAAAAAPVAASASALPQPVDPQSLNAAPLSAVPLSASQHISNAQAWKSGLLGVSGMGFLGFLVFR